MSNTKKSPRNDSLLIYVAVAFIAGFLCGAGFAVFKMSPGQGNQQAATEQDSISQQQAKAIAHLEGEVTNDPENFQAWTQLGHLYFDTGKYQEAVKAYETSLDLHAGNANIWTDLGVMYRRTDRPEKAIEAFDTAIKMDPSHETSRFNKGIVLLYDLNDFNGAIESWENLLQINPQAKTGNGESIRSFIDHLKNERQKQE